MNIFKRLYEWWTVGRHLCIYCDRESSAMYPSKALFEDIMNDRPEEDSFYFLFSKVTSYVTLPDGRSVPKGVKNYVFFVNPDWCKHDIKDPRKVMTHELVQVDGRIGIHAYQPTVEEIFTMYGVNEQKAKLKVEKSTLNGENYYIIKRPC